MPLFSYNTSSDEEGTNRSSVRVRPQKMLRMLNKYQLHNSLVGAPLHSKPKESPSGLLQTQKTIKDVSFKSQNVSTHTDTSERLKENLKLF